MTEKKSNKILGMIQMGIGVLSLIFAIVCFCLSVGGVYGSTEGNKSYGGDAYTGIQNAAAQTATNVYWTMKIVYNIAVCLKIIGGFAFVIVGLAFLAVGWKNYVISGEPVSGELVTGESAPGATKTMLGNFTGTTGGRKRETDISAWECNYCFCKNPADAVRCGNCGERRHD